MSLGPLEAVPPLVTLPHLLFRYFVVTVRVSSGADSIVAQSARSKPKWAGAKKVVFVMLWAPSSVVTYVSACGSRCQLGEGH